MALMIVCLVMPVFCIGMLLAAVCVHEECTRDEHL